MENANEMLCHFVGTDYYFSYQFDLFITEGVKEFADKFSAYWFLDIIASYHSQLRNEDFQVWTLKVKSNNSAVVICTDGNEKQLIVQEISFTDFNARFATIWVEGNVMLLPSEH